MKPLRERVRANEALLGCFLTWPTAGITELLALSGFDFLVLRSGSGEAPEELAQWWEKFQQAGEAERQAMLMAPQPGERRRRRRRRRSKSALPPPEPAQA